MKLQSADISKTLILIGCALNGFMMGSFRVVGYFGLGLLLIGTFISVKRLRLNRLQVWVLASIALILIRFLIQFATNEIFENSVRSALLQILTYVFILGICNSSLEQNDWKKIIDYSSRFYFFIGILLLIRNKLEYSDLFGTMYGNVLLVLFGVFLVDFRMNNKKLLVIIEMLLTLVMLYFSNMRSALVAALLGLVYVILPNKVIENKTFNRIVFVMILVICFSVPYIYLELYKPSTDVTAAISDFLQVATKQLTGSRLFSGRNIIWPNVLGAIDQMPLFGGGIGFTPSMVFDTASSTHNLFLFLRLEQGFVGLICFIFLIRAIWSNYNIYYQGKIKIAVQAVFVALMFQQTFSLGLLGGKGSFSFLSWMVLIPFTKRSLGDIGSNGEFEGINYERNAKSVQSMGKE